MKLQNSDYQDKFDNSSYYFKLRYDISSNPMVLISLHLNDANLDVGENVVLDWKATEYDGDTELSVQTSNITKWNLNINNPTTNWSSLVEIVGTIEEKEINRQIRIHFIELPGGKLEIQINPIDWDAMVLIEEDIKGSFTMILP